MKENKKNKKTTKQKQKQKQKQEQNVVVNINQPAKTKYKKRAQKAVLQQQQQAYRGPIMAPTYNPPIVLREPASTQNELFAKLFETKQERENTTQPNLLTGLPAPNIQTIQEKKTDDEFLEECIEKMGMITKRS